MKWIKHLSAAHADQEIAAVLEDHGAVAYGIYWLILEEISSLMETGKMQPESVHAVWKWADICNVSMRVLRRVLNSFAEKKLLFLEVVANPVQTQCKPSMQRLKIVVPNLLKYNDEYSKKSGHSPEPRVRGIRIEEEYRRTEESRESRGSMCSSEGDAFVNSQSPPPPSAPRVEEAAAAQPELQTPIPKPIPASPDRASIVQTYRDHCRILGIADPSPAIALELHARHPGRSPAESVLLYPRFPGQQSPGLWRSKTAGECAVELRRQQVAEIPKKAPLSNLELAAISYQEKKNRKEQ